jgi:SRSO17 transposase
LRRLVAVTKQRWLIERDYEELKQEGRLEPCGRGSVRAAALTRE